MFYICNNEKKTTFYQCVDGIDDIVRKGIFLPKGMPNFGNRFTAQQVKNIQQYIYSEAKKK